MDSNRYLYRHDEIRRYRPFIKFMQMTDYTWVIGVVVNLIGALFIVMQARVSLERRLSTLETYVKMLIRDRGINVRSSDNLDTIDDHVRRNGL